MSVGLTVRIVGDGPTVLLVHGSAADAGTWTMQLAALRGELRLIAYDRRAPHPDPSPAARGQGAKVPVSRAGEGALTVEEHAADAAGVIEGHGGGPVIACGSSFGAVVCLELARSRPQLVRGLVLCEPPLPPADDLPTAPIGFGCAFDHVAEVLGGPAAGEMFLRIVLGDAYDRLPARWREQAVGGWRAIRADSLALARYRPRYGGLAALRLPVQLVAGERSRRFFRPTLDALAAALPAARLTVIPASGHMMHVENPRAFNALLAAFARP
jgi:3-oxoadipate enol-lactonase